MVNDSRHSSISKYLSVKEPGKKIVCKICNKYPVYIYLEYIIMVNLFIRKRMPCGSN